MDDTRDNAPDAETPDSEGVPAEESAAPTAPDAPPAADAPPTAAPTTSATESAAAPPPATPPRSVAPSAVPPPAVATPAESGGHSGSTAGIIFLAIVIALLMSLVFGGLAGFAGAWMATNGADGDGSSTVRVLTGDTDEPVSAAAAAAVPTVVNIEVSGEPIDEGDEELPEGHPGVPRQGNGSGIAFQTADDGGTLIITNAHVVDDVSNIVVTGTDGERHKAELIGADDDTDIAVLKVDAEMPLIEVGDSDELQVGQLVVAIGSPFGLSHSVSSGVVSALGRAITQSFAAPQGTYPLVDVIQTDAAINPGNSGGALVDREGYLVGINSAIYSDTGQSGGIGFAIPVNAAISVAEQLIEDGSVDHPFLGIVGRTVDPVLAEQEDLPVEEGALVIEVTPDTGAADAGLTGDDVIVSLDGEPIRSMDDLILHVRRTKVGDEVTLELWRDGEQIEVIMVVGQKPENLELPEMDTPPELDIPEAHPPTDTAPPEE